jgi:hypothetical protein
LIVTIVAHLIVGGRPEPFLPAVLESLIGVADALVVNDNSGNPDSTNAHVLAHSWFAGKDRMIVDRTPFRDFATARNIVFDLHRKHFGNTWAAFVDADEVHRSEITTIARNLTKLPDDVGGVDGYIRHFVTSFRWYTSIERRRMFVQMNDEMHWSIGVHEHLLGTHGRTIVVPYVYDHYGWICDPSVTVEKHRLYSTLAQAPQEDLARINDERVHIEHFEGDLWPRVLPYHGDLPAATESIRQMIEANYAARAAYMEQRRAHLQPPLVRLSNAVRWLNFQYRWRGRAIDPLARSLLRDTAPTR